MTTEILPNRLEVPQLYYPKGPIRKIVSHTIARNDAIVGEVIIVRLECGHETTLCGPWPFEPAEVTVRCAYCHFDRRAQLLGEDGGRKA